MGFDSMSKFEVKNPKSRKLTKKKYKSKDFTNETSKNIDITENDIKQEKEVNKQNMRYKRQREKKQKLNTISDDVHKETINLNKEDNNFSGMEESQDIEDSDDKEAPPKKKANMHTGNNVDDTNQTQKFDTKTPKQSSKRELKRKKAEKRENEKRMASKMDAMRKGLSYVSKWKHARSEWKFEKIRQIWLIDNLLDETSIPHDIFPTVLEYFEGCKGMAREQLLKKGMDVIKKVEEDEENKDEVESIAYQRARKLLQALPTET